MFYQKALPKFRFLSHVNSLLTSGDRHWRKWPLRSKSRISEYTSVCGTFHMGAYKCNVVIKIGAYIDGVLILCRCFFPNFTCYGTYMALIQRQNLGVAALCASIDSWTLIIRKLC